MQREMLLIQDGSGMQCRRPVLLRFDQSKVVRSTACLSCACSPSYIKDYFCQRLRFFSRCFLRPKKITNGYRLLKLAFMLVVACTQKDNQLSFVVADYW